ncbi:unnamed protein product [Acanthoscelides obtectus]|uniref:Uncharacterized protein n=1 Tax=Acanthoscelides obtectus TaxID=200917 RepID=A0A9P0MDY4_ACAOB|nr:unnamed protein product [Acanthoscelides obtectus]CAK1669280.1 hypothetical protein AOBTE_LOCUS26921 [Acanthoscelides obtectus]
METEEEEEEEPTRLTADSTGIWISLPVSDVDDSDDDMWSIGTFVLVDDDPDQSHWHHSTHPDSPGPCQTLRIPDEEFVINGVRLSEAVIRYP